MNETDSQANLPQHVEETVLAVEQLQVEHHQNASRIEHFQDRFRAVISRPWFSLLIAVAIGGWIAANTMAPQALRLDPPPFTYLELAMSFAAVIVTILILATQRRADRLAEHREKLILQLAFVSERKTAKLIALVEELRRDLPHVPNRHDAEAEQMTEKADAASVSAALRPGFVATQQQE